MGNELVDVGFWLGCCFGDEVLTVMVKIFGFIDFLMSRVIGELK